MDLLPQQARTRSAPRAVGKARPEKGGRCALGCTVPVLPTMATQGIGLRYPSSRLFLTRRTEPRGEANIMVQIAAPMLGATVVNATSRVMGRSIECAGREARDRVFAASPARAGEAATLLEDGMP